MPEKIAGILVTRARMAYTGAGVFATVFGVWPESRNYMLEAAKTAEPATIRWAIGAVSATLAGASTYAVTRKQNTKKTTRACQNFHRLAHQTRNAKLKLNYITDREVARLRNTTHEDWDKAQRAFHIDLKRTTERQSRNCLDLLVQHLDKVHKQTSHRAYLQLVCSDDQAMQGEVRQVSVWELNAAVLTADRTTVAHVSEKYPGGRCTPKLVEQDTALNKLCAETITHYFAPSLKESDSTGYQTLTKKHEKGFGSKVVVPIRRPFYSENDGTQQIVHGFLTVLFKDNHAGVRIPAHPPNLTAGELSSILATIATHADSLASFFDNYSREAASYDEAWANRRAQLGVIDRRASDQPDQQNKARGAKPPLDQPRTVYYSAKVSALVHPDRDKFVKHEDGNPNTNAKMKRSEPEFRVRMQSILARRYPQTRGLLENFEHVTI